HPWPESWPPPPSGPSPLASVVESWPPSKRTSEPESKNAATATPWPTPNCPASTSDPESKNAATATPWITPYCPASVYEPLVSPPQSTSAMAGTTLTSAAELRIICGTNRVFLVFFAMGDSVTQGPDQGERGRDPPV